MRLDIPDPERRSATKVPGITGVRFLPQRTEALLVNISPSGVLLETVAKLQVGSAATVQFEGGFTPATATGRVVRCEVAVMGRDGLLRYYIGIEFDAPLDFDESLAGGTPAPASGHAINRW